MAKYRSDRGDPYLDPATGLLRNKVGAVDRETLERIEATVVAGRTAGLVTRPVQGTFDLDHLQRIHRRLFGDVYNWAGKLRTVGISKGHSMFARPEFIASEGANIFGRLAREQHLRGLAPDAFSARAAQYFGDVNALHPFREGNGRTQRAFFAQLADRAGYRIAWEGVTRDTMVHASIAVMHGDARPMAALLRAHLVERGPERGSARSTPTRGFASSTTSAPRSLVREPTPTSGARAEREQVSHATPVLAQREGGLALRVRFVAARLEQYERALMAGRAVADARERHAEARAAIHDARHLVRVADGADGAFTDALRRLYQDPERARATIDAAATSGIAAASHTIRTAPERFGVVQAGEPEVMRASAAFAADLSVRAAAAREVARRVERLTELVHVEVGTRERLRTMTAALGSLPAAEDLVRSAGRGVARLDEQEFAGLVRALPVHRTALAVTLRDGIMRALAAAEVTERALTRRTVVAARAAIHVHDAVQRVTPDELRAIAAPDAISRVRDCVHAFVRARVVSAIDAPALGRE